jgi:hypothetical protein
MSDLRKRLAIEPERLEELNAFLLDPGNELVSRLIELVERLGGPDAINRRAAEAGRLENLKARLAEQSSPYLDDLEWLEGERERGAFVSLEEYRRRLGGGAAEGAGFDPRTAVTLEISALQFFPWLIAEARRAIERQDLMPGRIIRVRCMKEQEADRGDILATAAAMQIIGASHVETLDTKGTDGSNVHLGGAETLTGYFGGIGQPNEYPLRWAEEYLYYYTRYGIRQVLNVNAGTILVAYLLHRMGIDNEFKISVFAGMDNPYSVLWVLLTARLFSRPDGATSLVGFNFSNSVNNDTIRGSHRVRAALGLTDNVRFEHHVTETWRSIVRQPYCRREELVEVAAQVPNISAKHEGSDPEVEEGCDHPSDILDYFLTRREIEERGLMERLQACYLRKHDSMNRTAEALTRAGIGVLPARRLHGAGSGMPGRRR